MKKILVWLALAVAGLTTAELVSSYVLFRYYAHSQKAILPWGSAALMLAKATINKARGKHPAVVLSIDHGRLFDASESLGYALRPGRYRIKEELEHRSHVFAVTVTDQGTRATSYFPIRSTKRLFVAGDSSMFGWGLDDEQTIPWLIQARVPNVEVINLSLPSYSTIHGLLQLLNAVPRIGPDDIVVIEYHELSNELNVASAEVMANLAHGFEMQLGDASGMRETTLPFGSIDSQGKFSIQRISLSCASDGAKPGCARPKFDAGEAMKVTIQAFDEIIALRPGHLVIAFLSGADHDPVIDHLLSRGALIADLRTDRGAPLEEDLIFTDSHSGPFSRHQLGERLFETMLKQQVVN